MVIPYGNKKSKTNQPDLKSAEKKILLSVNQVKTKIHTGQEKFTWGKTDKPAFQGLTKSAQSCGSAVL